MSFDLGVVDALHRSVADRLNDEHRLRARQGFPELLGDDEQQFTQKLIANAVAELTEHQRITGQPRLSEQEEQRLFEAVHARLFRLDSDLVRSLQRKVGNRIADERSRRLEQGVPELLAEHEQQFAHKVIADVIGEHAEQLLLTGQAPLASHTEERLATAIHARIFGVGQLQTLLSEDSIENIDINGCDEVWITRAGQARHERVEPVASTDEELIELISGLASYAGLNSRPWDAANPELDLQLPDGSRLSAIMGASARPSVSIRRHRFEKVEMSDLVGNGTFTEEAAEFLKACVKARMNIMIAGATRAGKTTTLRALAAEIGPEERLITIESTLELNLAKDRVRHPNCLEWEERVANSEGLGGIPMRNLVRRTKRQNPDRVIVGEVLGPEVLDMLNAMCQGNDGSLSTIHARSAEDVVDRIATYAVMAPERVPHETTHQLIAGGMDFLVFVSRDPITGKRRLDTILEVSEYDAGVLGKNTVFAIDETGQATYTGCTLRRAERLTAAGWVPPGSIGW